jgi:hypothetical protein
MNDDPMCKGSFVLGTACGWCKRCRDEAVKLVPELLAEKKRYDDFMDSRRDDHAKIRLAAVESLAEAMKVIAPDLMQEFVARYHRRQAESENALERFLAALRRVDER